MAGPVEDDMVEHGKPQGFSGGDKLPGNLQAFNTGIEIAGRMIIGKNNRRCPFGYRVGEDFPGMDLGFIDQADGDDSKITRKLRNFYP